VDVRLTGVASKSAARRIGRFALAVGQRRASMTLSEEALSGYGENGYLLVEDLVPMERVVALRERVREYTHGGRRCDVLRFQVEPRVERGEMVVENPGDGIRKIDSLVQGDDLFRELALVPRIVGIIADIVGPDIKMFRNSLMLKPPEVGSPKGWHQDSPYWPIEPMDLCSCWFPLDDATLENGCMMVVAGGHKRGPLPHVNVTDDYVIADGTLDTSAAVAVPMRAGGGLFFHSLVPHYTAPNRSRAWRRAMVLSYMSARSRLTGEEPGPEFFSIRGVTYPGCVR
jgi:ectoine hydroxylase-related dioxygenase (phytanoyl-CoA dioxygenase family)